ncbi:probable small intestine urate exporter isoform X3 [Trachemys scripta elegans]|uniref:probable small intestine urate exporter isoform X3 n=1 Tax=Trachemys scripta elegans TaxID=31138 RepID=UPI001555CE46|nr:probable small intestine urate exporter isoform X3 [Trachemys scripta elegans]
MACLSRDSLFVPNLNSWHPCRNEFPHPILKNKRRFLLLLHLSCGDAPGRRTRCQLCLQERMQQSAENAEAEACPESDQEDASPLLNQQLSFGKGLCSARYSLALILHFSLFMVYSLRVNLSIAIVAMTNGTNPGSLPNNSTDVCPNRSHAQPNDSHREFAQEAPVYDWSAKTQGVILSAFFYGYLFTQLLGGYWSGMFGGKLVLGYGLLSTSALTLLVPLAASLGAPYLIGLQALLGMAEGVIFPAQYTLWAKWAPPLERSRLMNLAEAGCTFGTFITFPAAGIICQYLGWPYIFFIFAHDGGPLACVAAAQVVSTLWMRALRAVGLAPFILKYKSIGINKVQNVLVGRAPPAALNRKECSTTSVSLSMAFAIHHHIEGSVTGQISHSPPPHSPHTHKGTVPQILPRPALPSFSH